MGKIVNKRIDVMMREKVNFIITESSSKERERENEEKYKEFLEIWKEHPDWTKSKILKMFGAYTTNNALSKYIARRMKEDGLFFGNRGRTSKFDILVMNHTKKELYRMFKEDYVNSTHPMYVIRKKYGLTINLRAYDDFMSHILDEGYDNPWMRGNLIKKGEWIGAGVE